MTDTLIIRALEAAVESPSTAMAAWHAVEDWVLERAIIVPLMFRAPAVPLRCGPRVANPLCDPRAGLFL